jgi:predicted amidohydrolase
LIVLRVGFVQINSRLADVEWNIDRAFQLVGNKQIDLLVLPELFNTGYNFRDKRQLAKLAEPIPRGPTAQIIREFSKQEDNMIVAGMAERKGQSMYNSAVIVKSGEYLGTYRKIHLFYNEKKFFAPGREFKVFGKVGVMICFDWIFPESARTLMLKGAEVIAHPSNLVMPHCPDSMKTRALENHIYVVTADRVGVERGLRFIGQSQIVSPQGRVIYRGSPTNEECTVRGINLELARDKSVTPRNDLVKDRVPQAYVS